MRNTDKRFVVARLERKRLAVDQLQQQLNSYRCAPTTVVLFERKENLQTGLNELASNTENLLLTLRENDIQLVNYSDNVARQFEDFNTLHQEVAQYVRVAAS